MFMLVIQSLLLIALAYLIGCLLGCLARRFFGSAQEPRYVPVAQPDNAATMTSSSASSGTSSKGVAAAGAATAAVTSAAVMSQTDEAEAAPVAPTPQPAKIADKPAPKATAANKPASKTGSARASGSKKTEPDDAKARGTVKPATKAAAPKTPNEKAKAAPVKKLTAAQLKKEEAEASAKLAALPKGASAEDKANAVGKKPRGLPQARKTGADDLKQIKGVGQVIEGKLNAQGIWHFDQIAKWGRPEILWFDTFLSFKGRIDRDDWIKQAGILASGGETEFSKRVSKGVVSSSLSKKK